MPTNVRPSRLGVLLTFAADAPAVALGPGAVLRPVVGRESMVATLTLDPEVAADLPSYGSEATIAPIEGTFEVDVEGQLDALNPEQILILPPDTGARLLSPSGGVALLTFVPTPTDLVRALFHAEHEGHGFED